MGTPIFLLPQKAFLTRLGILGFWVTRDCKVLTLKYCTVRQKIDNPSLLRRLASVLVYNGGSTLVITRQSKYAGWVIKHLLNSHISLASILRLFWWKIVPDALRLCLVTERMHAAAMMLTGCFVAPPWRQIPASKSHLWHFPIVEKSFLGEWFFIDLNNKTNDRKILRYSKDWIPKRPEKQFSIVVCEKVLLLAVSQWSSV